MVAHGVVDLLGLLLLSVALMAPGIQTCALGVGTLIQQPPFSLPLCASLFNSQQLS